MSDPVGRFYYNFFGFIRCLLQEREKSCTADYDYAEVQGQWWVYLSCLCQWANTSTFSPHVSLPAPKHIMECGFHVSWERDSRERHHPWLKKEMDGFADLWHCFNKKIQHTLKVRNKLSFVDVVVLVKIRLVLFACDPQVHSPQWTEWNNWLANKRRREV